MNFESIALKEDERLKEVILGSFAEELTAMLPELEAVFSERSPAETTKPMVHAVPSRAALGFFYLKPKLIELVRWLAASREDTNFTYDLTALDKSYSASVVSLVTGSPFEDVTSYFNELENNQTLAAHVKRVVMANPSISNMDLTPKFGRRFLWYAFVRCLKPSFVVETGVDKGLGSIVICSALLRNGSEGSPGLYLGTDFNPAAGVFLQSPYSNVGKIAYQDSLTTLRALNRQIDIFINDSDHSAEYEAAEYETIRNHLSEKSIVLGDNSHCTDKLMRFSQRLGRKFLFHREQPANHWYPGGGVGIMF